MNAIDLFAGIGGNTEAAKMAGLDVVWAANHNPIAVEFHSLNHPEAIHSCQDLQQADWSQVPAHNFGIASPCCQGHTDARGKEGPHHHKSRSTAWAPVSCWEYHRPEVFLIENVPKFLNWKLFPQWKSCFESLGYSLSINTFDAADSGVPQNRERVFIIGTQSKNPIEISIPKRPHVGVNSIIEWDYARWSLIEKPGRAAATLERVKNGRKRFGDRFVMPYYKSGSGKTGRCLSRPIGTITTKDRWAVVDGDKMRMLNINEYRKAMSFGDHIKLPKTRTPAIQLLGNATCPVQVRDVLKAVKKAI
ncbi:DNA cytosine methyltransferase [Aliikangiella coralliicola]|uniref:DNA (cytosine-5-)-methyltransferase n=1 Tax=Aliikangiella coralliicola TaxID=2592383 RepID=A0A545U020_9GAMM|nr:DNA cytosine methyltransferase [Aliikangiella coralliicola]TQV82818.1 DNA cytosine methyltransferase [Aliikangiella coralliicola]